MGLYDGCGVFGCGGFDGFFIELVIYFVGGYKGVVVFVCIGFNNNYGGCF